MLSSSIRPLIANRTRASAPLSLWLLAVLLLATIPTARVPLAPSVESPASSGVAAPSALAEQAAPKVFHNPRRLPPDLVGHPELIAQRTANSATFDLGGGHYTAIVAQSPLHYQDSQGQWQIIDPTFQARPESFIVEQNALQSRAGQRRAWLSTGVGETGLNWRATDLGVVDADGAFSALASALAEPSNYAEQRDDGRTLHYSGGWSDPGLDEEIVSAPGSVEHLLVLSAAPHSAGAPQYLELRATLKLLPGATLWAEGRQQTGAFDTTGALEIHDAAGRPALALDPVRAYEQERSDLVVAGEYRALPGAKAGEWTIDVRTPWHWWADSARHYPAVIDPTMHVLTTVGYGSGLAWVSNYNNTGFDKIVLGAYDIGDGGGIGWTTQTRGYMQFNNMPAMITTPGGNPLIQITGASLDVAASIYHMPYYKHDEGDFPDWDSVVLQPAVMVKYLGGCPSDPSCGGFGLAGNSAPGMNYASTPAGQALVGGSDDVLTIGPLTPDNSPGTTTWNVTAEIQNWLTNWYQKPAPRPFHGPTFSIALKNACPWFSTFIDDNSQFIPPCTSVKIAPGGAQLRINYSARQLAFNASFLDSPGVPSYIEKVFELNNLDNTTNHQYALATNAGPAAWRGVAVRGNHALAPATAARTGLRLLDYSGNAHTPLASAVTQAKDQTAFALIDDRSASGIASADVRAEVTASNENDYANDQNRNYRIDYVKASSWSISNGNWFTQNISFNSGRLLSLGEFTLPAGNNLLVRVTVPQTLTLDMALIEPSSGSQRGDAVIGNNDSHVVRGFQPTDQPIHSRYLGSGATGVWALALVNQGRPVPDPKRTNFPQSFPVKVEILTCPNTTIATDKWGCQPLILPDSTVPPSRTALGLTVYSEGDFTAAQGGSWCTKNEGQGAPIIGPSANNRWAVVAQGSICWDGTKLTTTSDSAVGLAYAVNPPTNPQYGTVPVDFVYGSTALSPLPAGYPTGVVQITASGGPIAPQANTQRNIRPFNQYWSTVFTPGSDNITLNDMQANATGTVSAKVTVDAGAAPSNITWQVPWSFYPAPGSPKLYNFSVTPNQSPAFPSPASIASLQLRILGPAPGKINSSDVYLTAGGPVAGQFHAASAKITQDAQLGGATKLAEVVVQPPGQQRLPDAQKSCSAGGAATSCLDLRDDSYAWNNGDGDKNVQPWELPDVHLDQSAGSMLLSTPGRLEIYSKDHPAAVHPADVQQNFSFDTWGGSVSVKDEACDPGGPIVTVVRGKAQIALPSLGDDGSDGSGVGISVQFKLCETSLREAKLTFAVPPSGIPVGATGVGVYFISGEVVIGPTSTRITITLKFETTDGGQTIGDAYGTVIIDTAGLFDLTAHAKIVKIVDADLHLQVAWNPIDILLDASASCCGGLISGALHLHAWIGQGWQHKYNWLPDDDQFHFTGSIQATLFIPEGYIADIGITELPPFDIEFGIKIAFGQFCQNDTCTKYGWGMSASFTIFGFDIGLYVDDTGPSLILGSDDHKLIDQFQNVALQSAAPQAMPSPQLLPNLQLIKPGNLQLFLKPPLKTPVSSWPHNLAGDPTQCSGFGTSTHICKFSVSQGAGRALFVAGWMNGNLQVTLLKPDGTPITASNAAANGVTITISDTALLHQVAFAVKPAGGLTALPSGVWKLKLENVGQGMLPGINNNYQLLFATDPPAPTLTLNTPATQGVTPDGSGKVALNWTALRAGQPLGNDTKIELVYTPVISKPVDPTDFTGVPIVGLLNANQGSYQWDTRGLASGEYAVGARLDDHRRGNGPVVAWAPGTVVINDTTPPPPPSILGTVSDNDGLIVLWQRDTLTPDLAGYLVDYTIPNWDGTPIQKTRRVLPHGEGFNQWLLVEHIRLGGLLNGIQTTFCLKAYDASGNVSGCTPTNDIPRPVPTIGAPIRLSATVVAVPGAGPPVPSLKVDWGAPLGSAAPAGYLLSYRPFGCIMPGTTSKAQEGKSPIDVGSANTFTLHGLTVAQRYQISVRAYTTQKFVGPAATTTVLYALSYNAWIAEFGLSGANAATNADPDGDGLLNQQEYTQGSNPLNADSDGDGYYDGEEFVGGGNVCGPAHPATHSQPKLVLAGQSLLVFQAASNIGATHPQTIKLLNFGNGALNWTAGVSAPWIKLSKTSGVGFAPLAIWADPAGLAPGHYSGKVTISSLAVGPGIAPETASIDVSLDVHPPKQVRLFLPAVQR
jgi:hypothetical protein